MLRADEPITGTARMIDKTGATVRRWTLDRGHGRRTGPGTAATRAGRTVADGRYTFRVRGLDRAGNQTVRDLTVAGRPDDQVADLVALVVRPAVGPEGPRHVRPRAARRPSPSRSTRATTLVRDDLDGPAVSPPGRYGWTWNGRTAAGALVEARHVPGRGRCHELDRLVDASRRNVTVKAP